MQPSESAEDLAFIDVDLARNLRRIRNAAGIGSDLVDRELNFCVEILGRHVTTLASFKILNSLLVFLRGSFGLERAEISSLAGLRIFLSRIQSITALNFSDHGEGVSLRVGGAVSFLEVAHAPRCF